MKGSGRSSFSDVSARKASARPRPSAEDSSKIWASPDTPTLRPDSASPYAALSRTSRSSPPFAMSRSITG